MSFIRGGEGENQACFICSGYKVIVGMSFRGKLTNFRPARRDPKPPDRRYERLGLRLANVF